MTAFQETRIHTEQKVMVHLLSEIERNPSFTQRGLASELDIALGLMNYYLKQTLLKGWVRALQLSPRRVRYFITPEGFKEKSHMVKNYLARSMTFFRDARAQCENMLILCTTQGWNHIALVGSGDLADIAKLVASKTGITITIMDTNDIIMLDHDAYVITDLMNPQGTYDKLKDKINYNRLLILDLLHISRELL